MLAEFLDKLVGLGRASDKAEFIDHPKVPHCTWLRQGAQVEAVDLPNPERHPSLVGVADVVDALKDPLIATAPEVYYDQRGIVAFLNRGERRERLSMPFVRSAKWLKLEALARSPETHTTAGAIKMLRFELHSTGTEHVIQALRRVDFTRKSDGSRVVEHGRESLGRAVEARVQSADDIPEVFKVSTPVFLNPGLRQYTADVRCGVYIDVAKEAIEIRVLTDELAHAMDSVFEQMSESLREQLGCPVFYGSPGAP